MHKAIKNILFIIAGTLFPPSTVWGEACFTSGIQYKFRTAYEKLGYSVSIETTDDQEIILTAFKGELGLTVRYALQKPGLEMTTAVTAGAYTSTETEILKEWDPGRACCGPVPMPLDRYLGLTIYPERVESEALISVYNTTASSLHLRIIQPGGKVVKSTDLETFGFLHWDTAGLSRGNYLVQAQVNGKSRYAWVWVDGTGTEVPPVYSLF